MGSKPHFVGHRVEDISFKRGWVKCDCGLELRVAVDPDPAIISHDALAAASAAHRKEEAVKAASKVSR